MQHGRPMGCRFCRNFRASCPPGQKGAACVGGSPRTLRLAAEHASLQAGEHQPNVPGTPSITSWDPQKLLSPHQGPHVVPRDQKKLGVSKGMLMKEPAAVSRRVGGCPAFPGGLTACSASSWLRWDSGPASHVHRSLVPAIPRVASPPALT